MLHPARGEVWVVDLGLAAKARPAIVCSIPFLDSERAVYAVIPHTTAVRGGRFEIVIKKRFLAEGAFDVQGLRNIPGTVFMQRIGVLEAIEMERIADGIRSWLAV